MTNTQQSDANKKVRVPVTRVPRGASRRVSTPTVLQMEAVECGAASLAMILAHYGLWVPLEELRITCGVSRDGAKAAKILKAARSYGLEAKGLKLELEEVFKQPTPFIAFWNFNHFVVVEGFRGRYVFINDPASGPRSVLLSDFRKSFTGVILHLSPGADFKPGGEKPSALKRLIPRLAHSKSSVGYVIAVSLLLIIPGLVLPAVLKAFTDEVLIRGFSTWLMPLIVGLILAGILNSALTYLQQTNLLKLQTKLGVTMASEFFWHVLRVPVVFYTQRYVGDVASRVQTCHRLASLLAGPLPTTIVHLFTAIFFTAIMFLYSVKLTIVVIALTLLNVIILKLVHKKNQDLNAVSLNQVAQLMGASMAGLQAMETLKSTGTENDFFQTWSGYQTNTVNTNQRLGYLGTLMGSAPGLINQLTTTSVLGVGALLIMDGQLTIGGLVAFQALMSHFTTPVQSLVSFAGQMQQIAGDINLIQDVQEYEIDPSLVSDDFLVDDEDNKVPSGMLSGSIELRDVSFGYDPLEPPLIEGFSIALKPGQRVAFVGGSGSGKSTISKLILGLYQPTSGEILFDSLPVKNIPRSIFTSSVASVDQDIFMFSGTIFQNLTLWNDMISQVDVVAAAKDACIHDVISSRGSGYHGDISEQGANFSGGQKQRLEIARALVRNPTVLVLDEATSALDPTTEKQIDDAIRRRGCTCVIVAHRLSTIRDCDEIVVLDRGKVVERGNHKELMSLDGRYAQLVAIQ